MFSDPQSVTVNAVAKSLPRISSGDRKGVFRHSTGEFVLTISHDEKSRSRRTVRLTQEKVAADPFQTDVNRTYTQHAYIVIDAPKVGFTPTEVEYLTDALTAYLAGGTIATQVIAGES